MNNITDLIFQRRSIRKFTGEKISDTEIKELQRAALAAPTSKNCKSWEFVFVTDPASIKDLSLCKEAGAQFLEGAALAIVVLGNPEKTDVWVEDASIAAAFIQLQAEALGLGSCWAQIRERGFSDGRKASDIVKNMLNAPASLEVECIIGIGHKDQQRSTYSDEKLPWDQIHMEKF
ncbi:MAG: nitroreductase family protein [Bacteroidales bacterium]|nr:nitroreductase family protein [Bacteroidales bacterium]